MTGEQIRDLLKYIPEGSAFPAGLGSPSLDLTDVEYAMFAGMYKHLDFGWKFCQLLVLNNLDLPPVSRNDHVLLDAFFHLRYPHRYTGEIIRRAKFMATSPEMRRERTLLNAALISSRHFKEDTHQNAYEEISRELGSWQYPVEFIHIYEKLFFNILDRMDDRQFIQSIVYPDTRMVELNDRYAQEENFDNILLRMGFNHGLPDVLYMSGISDHTTQYTLAGADAAKNLEDTLYSQALVLMRSGFLHQRGQPTMARASQLLNSQKLSRDNGASNDTPFDGPLGDAMLKDVDLFQAEQLRRVNQLRVEHLRDEERKAKLTASSH